MITKYSNYGSTPDTVPEGGDREAQDPELLQTNHTCKQLEFT